MLINKYMVSKMRNKINFNISGYVYLWQLLILFNVKNQG